MLKLLYYLRDKILSHSKKSKRFEMYLRTELEGDLSWAEYVINLKRRRAGDNLEFIADFSNFNEDDYLFNRMRDLYRNINPDLHNLPTQLREEFNEKYAKIYRLLELKKHAS